METLQVARLCSRHQDQWDLLSLEAPSGPGPRVAPSLLWGVTARTTLASKDVILLSNYIINIVPAYNL